MKRKIEGLYAIIDATYVALPDMERTASGILGAGAGVLQLRAKGRGAGPVLEASRVLKRVALEYGALFIVNDRVDLAVLSGADGAHLGQDDIPLSEARRLLGPDSVIGVSTHDATEARRAREEGADYISFGPIFATSTKKDAQSPRGVEYLREIRKTVTLPIVAIGGITENNAAEVLSAGADSVAVISGILLSKDIPGRAASIISRIKRAKDA